MSNTQRKGTRGGRVKVVVVLVGILLAVAAGTIATHWMRSTGGETGASAATATRAEAPTRIRIVAPAPLGSEVVHADVYFDFKSVRLRADAVRVLQEQAALMDRASVWGVLVQGYADRQGPAEYNKALAQRRADAVKQFLVELGAHETSVKTVTLGPDAAICEEPTRECQQLNRRVHIEIRKLPRAAAAPVRPPLAEGDVFETPSNADSSALIGR